MPGDGETLVAAGTGPGWGQHPEGMCLVVAPCEGMVPVVVPTEGLGMVWGHPTEGMNPVVAPHEG